MHDNAVVPLISAYKSERKYHNKITLAFPIDGMYIFILSTIVDHIPDNLLRIVVVISYHVFSVRRNI
jgi:predicted AAA+ superfamily ATPase